MDRIAILLDHQDAMLASVMHPVASTGSKVQTPSILPFLARSAQGDAALEAFLRPRLPVLGSEKASKKRTLDDVEPDTDEDMPKQRQRRVDSPLIVSEADLVREAQVDEQREVPMIDDASKDAGGTSDGKSIRQPEQDEHPEIQQNENIDSSTNISTTEAPAEQPVWDVEHPGIPRTDEASVVSGTTERQQMSQPQPVKQVIEVTETSVSVDGLPVQVQHSQTANRSVAPPSVAKRNNFDDSDSDSSDFEMPTLDTTLDTDEEDMEDD
jgi:hypothetical protein